MRTCGAQQFHSQVTHFNPSFVALACIALSKQAELLLDMIVVFTGWRVTSCLRESTFKNLSNAWNWRERLVRLSAYLFASSSVLEKK